MPNRAWGRALEQPDQASLAAQLVEEEADPHPPFALSPTIRESSKMTLLGRPVLGLSINPTLLSEEKNVPDNDGCDSALKMDASLDGLPNVEAV